MPTGQPTFDIKPNDNPPMKGFYFVLLDSEGNQQMESNVYDDKDLCRVGAEEELKNWIEGEKIS